MSEIILKHTNGDSNLLEYIKKVNSIPILTQEQEYNCYIEASSGNMNAAKMLVSSHLRLVVSIAGKYVNYGLSMIDLINEGNIGLMRAMKSFDYKKGYKLATYSAFWIRAYIQEYILKGWSVVKIGTSSLQKKLFFNLGKVKKFLLNADNKRFGNAEVEKASKMLNADKQDIIDMNNRLTKRDTSLNMKVGNDEENGELIDFVTAKIPTTENLVNARFENRKIKVLLTDTIKKLDEKEQEIIKLRYITDKSMTLPEIGKKLGISSERVRQIESKAIEKMKKCILC
ncbi:MAG: RNA polymerase sigma factor RpoH [Rickettsiales bacterium]|nr:MAG: RNA polymerase sigma factor RpoH [Rickettsiales bacterium]